MEDAMSDYKKGEWIRDGDLLFTLEHDGWRKGGVEQLKNRIMVRIDVTKSVPAEEAEHLIAKLHEFLIANVPVVE
jgi:hypothetical protein